VANRNWSIYVLIIPKYWCGSSPITALRRSLASLAASAYSFSSFMHSASSDGPKTKPKSLPTLSITPRTDRPAKLEQLHLVHRLRQCPVYLITPQDQRYVRQTAEQLLYGLVFTPYQAARNYHIQVPAFEFFHRLYRLRYCTYNTAGDYLHSLTQPCLYPGSGVLYYLSQASEATLGQIARNLPEPVAGGHK